jgi:signal transduction histidine kinase
MSAMEDDRYALLGRMTTGVAHDLNNYLTVVDVALALMQRPADPMQRLELERARYAMDASIRLIRTLLEYARGGTAETTDVDLGAVVQRVLEVVARLISYEVVVIVDVDSDTPLISGVASELEQLVLNLVLNARDAMPNGGTLHLVLRTESPSKVALEVSDTGEGLDAAAADAIGTTTPSKKPGRNGRGLGLGIVRSVVDRHGAELKIAPRTGGGTRVTVSFRRS